MIEFEITSQLSEIYDRSWLIFQIWIGVSFAVAALAHFAADRLNYLFAFIAIALYATFTFFINQLVNFNVEILEAFLEDLRELREAGQLLTQGAQQHIESYEDISTAMSISTITNFCFFVGVIVYLLHAVHARRRRNRRSGDAAE